MNIKKQTAIILILTVFLIPSHAFAATEFKDVLRTHHQYVAISHLQQTGVIKGYGDYTFKPGASINRAESLKIILQAAGIESPEKFELAGFSDVKPEDWYAKYVAQAKKLNIIQGDTQEGGNFLGGRPVNKAEFIKMLLIANQTKEDLLTAEGDLSDDAPKDAWFTPYLSYALKRGMVYKNDKGLLEPNKSLTRGEVAEIIYLSLLIKNSANTQFLLHRAEAELSQIEVYVAANKIENAKRASELAVDMTQQAIKNLPQDKVVLGAGKLAKAYDLLVDSFIAGIQKQNESAEDLANQAIKKATEAWEVNSATQPIARHIKDRAREILKQIGGVEL